MSFLMESSAVGQPSPLGFSNTLNALPGAVRTQFTTPGVKRLTHNLILRSSSYMPPCTVCITSTYILSLASPAPNSGKPATSSATLPASEALSTYLSRHSIPNTDRWSAIHPTNSPSSPRKRGGTSTGFARTPFPRTHPSTASSSSLGIRARASSQPTRIIIRASERLSLTRSQRKRSATRSLSSNTMLTCLSSDCEASPTQRITGSIL